MRGEDTKRRAEDDVIDEGEGTRAAPDMNIWKCSYRQGVKATRSFNWQVNASSYSRQRIFPEHGVGRNGREERNTNAGLLFDPCGGSNTMVRRYSIDLPSPLARRDGCAFLVALHSVI